MQTRFSRTLERKSQKRLILNVVGTIIILILLVKFGIPLLINLSLVFGGKGGSVTTSAKSDTFIAPPILNPAFTATNSASIIVSGSAPDKTTVKLYVNNEVVDSMQVADDGTFSFDKVALNSGDNTIKAKATKDKNESDFSDPMVVTYANKAPNLSIDSPSDGQGFSKDQNTVEVKGKTDPNVKITVNDFWAITDSSGNYSYTLKLQNGDNQIKVVATDDAGNTADKTIKVTYSQ